MQSHGPADRDGSSYLPIMADPQPTASVASRPLYLQRSMLVLLTLGYAGGRDVAAPECPHGP